METLNKIQLERGTAYWARLAVEECSASNDFLVCPSRTGSTTEWHSSLWGHSQPSAVETTLWRCARGLSSRHIWTSYKHKPGPYLHTQSSTLPKKLQIILTLFKMNQEESKRIKLQKSGQIPKWITQATAGHEWQCRRNAALGDALDSRTWKPPCQSECLDLWSHVVDNLPQSKDSSCSRSQRLKALWKPFSVPEEPLSSRAWRHYHQILAAALSRIPPQLFSICQIDSTTSQAKKTKNIKRKEGRQTLPAKQDTPSKNNQKHTNNKKHDIV